MSEADPRRAGAASPATPPTDDRASVRPLVRDVLLRDGSTLRLRAPVSEDFDDLKAFYDGLSPESRYMRFHGYGRTDAVARQDAESDGVDRVTLIGHHQGKIVAVAGYDVLREPGAAEVAFAVADDFRARGTATRLLEQLAEIAAARGLRRFDAEVLTENRAMLGVFREAGFALRRHGAWGELTVSLDITPSPHVLERIDERTHQAAVASLRALVAPRSVAVIGARPGPESIGGAVVRRLIEGGFRGPVSAVNDTGEVVSSMRPAASLSELPEPPELVITAVAFERTSEIAAEAASLGCKAMLVLASEHQRDEASDRQHGERLLEIARTSGIRVVGPHSLGVVNTDPEVSLSAMFARPPTVRGGLAVCSQSGAIGVGLVGHASARRLGISTFASLGERLDVSTNDLLELWEEDARTAAVMLYLESFGNPERFARLARRVARRKPVLVVKGNRPPDDRRRPGGSHTAAALRGDAVVDALLIHAGVQRFRSGDELFNAAEFFESQPLPRGRRVGIVSNSAGVATLAVDACATRGLVVGAVGETPEDVPVSGERVTPRQPLRNPTVLPIAVTPQDYASAVAALLGEPDVDSVMAYYVDSFAGQPEAVLSAVAGAADGAAKPVVASVVAADGTLPVTSGRRVPNFIFPESCATVIHQGVRRREWLSRPLGQRPQYAGIDADAGAQAQGLIRGCLEDAAGHAAWLGPTEAEALLALYGLPLVPSVACQDAEAAVRAASDLDAPIALKANFPAPAHGSDIDAVLLGLEGEAAARAGWLELERRVKDASWTWGGALVQRLVAPGADVLLGAVKDPEYGSVMALGVGGRQAGLGSNAAVRMPPCTDVEADELIDASPGVIGQLGGFRGRPPLDRAALREVILRFALLLADVPNILEADLNPTRVMRDGAAILDVRIRVGDPPPRERVKTW